jgi:hypothetical protein
MTNYELTKQESSRISNGKRIGTQMTQIEADLRGFFEFMLEIQAKNQKTVQIRFNPCHPCSNLLAIRNSG